jgi:hypothetical protein
VRREVREVVWWFNLAVGCLVVAGHGALLGSAMAAKVMACSGGRRLNRGAPAIEEDEAEVSMHVIEHRDGWSDGTAVAAELGRQSWRWRALRCASARCGQSKGEREGMERVAKSVVHVAEATVLGALGAAAMAKAPLSYGGRGRTLVRLLARPTRLAVLDRRSRARRRAGERERRRREAR